MSSSVREHVCEIAEEVASSYIRDTEALGRGLGRTHVISVPQRRALSSDRNRHFDRLCWRLGYRNEQHACADSPRSGLLECFYAS